MEIAIEPVFLRHENGSKFYEVIQFYNVSAKSYVVAYRWGKMSDYRGGGQVKVEHHYDILRCQQAARKKVAEKSSRGYEVTAVSCGFHDALSGYGASIVLRVSDVEAALDEHYKSLEAAGSIAYNLKLTYDGKKIDRIAIDDIVEEGVDLAPEVDRGDSWGSW